MSNERDFENRDARVSEAYRKTAEERAPETLNQTVLSMAAGKAANRPSGILFASWVRPVAWAATIGLSLAIVLEVTRLPAPMDTVVPAPASRAVESVRQDFERQENRAVEAAKELEQMQTGPNSQDVLDEVAAEEAAVEQAPVERVAPEAVAAEGAAVEEALVERVAPEAVAIEEIAIGDAGPDEDDAAFAADAPMRDQNSFAARSRVTGLAASVQEKKESDDAADCDTEARAAADTWFLCIEALRESGDMPAAEREYADFLLEHPDPEAHK